MHMHYPEDAQLLIVEEDDTCDGNSDRIYLNEDEMKQLQALSQGDVK